MDNTELRKEFDKHVNFIKSATTIQLAEKRINDAFHWISDEIDKAISRSQNHDLLLLKFEEWYKEANASNRAQVLEEIETILADYKKCQ
jgi:hypothetical protein